MSWRRDLGVLLTAAVLLVGWMGPSPAWGHHDPDHECDEDAVIGDGEGEAGAECETGTDPGQGGECDPDSEEIAYYGNPPDEHVDWYLQFALTNPPPEGMTYKAAYNCAGRYLGGPHLIPDPDWVPVEALREEARTRLAPAPPTPSVSPAEAVVRFPTWLWVAEADWQPASATATDGSVTVRVEARPVRATWDLVEGTRVCEGPGVPWSQEAHDAYEAQPADVRGRGNPACTFEFTNSSTTQPDGVYHASVTVIWEFRWWLGAEDRGVFGTVEATAEFDLRVGEIQTLITR